MFTGFRFPAAVSVLSSVTCGCVKYLFSRKIYNLIFDSISRWWGNSLFQWFIIYTICLKLMPLISHLILSDFNKTTLIFFSCLPILRPFGLFRENPDCPSHVKHPQVCLAAWNHLLFQQERLVSPVLVNNSVFNSFSSLCLT